MVLGFHLFTLFYYENSKPQINEIIKLYSH